MNPDVYDSSCDYCGKQVGTANLTPITVGNSVSWQCRECHERTEQRYREAVGEAA